MLLQLMLKEPPAAVTLATEIAKAQAETNAHLLRTLIEALDSYFAVLASCWSTKNYRYLFFPPEQRGWKTKERQPSGVGEIEHLIVDGKPVVCEIWDDSEEIAKRRRKELEKRDGQKPGHLA